jgi:hypothetical protein
LRTAVRVGNPFPAASGKFTVAIFLNERHRCAQRGPTTSFRVASGNAWAGSMQKFADLSA